MIYTASRDQIHAPLPALEIREHRELFPTGRWTITPSAIAVLAYHHVDPVKIIWRHRAGDWGDVELAQAMANNDATQEGGPIRSAYCVGCDVVYIETAADGRTTGIFTAEDF